MKRVWMIALLVMLLIPAVALAAPQDTYDEAETLMAEGKYIEAAELFESISSFSDAAKSAMYARANDAMYAGNYEIAHTTFENLGDYRDCSFLLDYCLALYGESTGDSLVESGDYAKAIETYNATIELFQQNPFFRDGQQRVEEINGKITEAEGKEAERIQNVYDEAIALLNSAKYTEAAELFESIGDYSDAADGATYARAYEALEAGRFEDAKAGFGKVKDYRDSTLERGYCDARTSEANEDYASALKFYEQNPDFRDSGDRIADVSAKKEAAEEAARKAEEEAQRAAEEAAEIEAHTFATYSGLHEGLFSVGRVIERSKYEKPAILYGYMNTKGELVIPFEWDEVKDFSEGMAAVSDSWDLWGYIDVTGKLVVPCEYRFAYDFSEGLAMVIKDGFCGYVDASGKLAIPCSYDAADGFSEGLAAVAKFGEVGWFYIDKTGEAVFSAAWNRARSFKEGLAPVQEKNDNPNDGKWGYIDKTGKLAIPYEWDDAGCFSEGYAWVKKGETYGFINSEGKLVVPCEWTQVSDFKEGLACVCEGHYPNNQWHFIDTAGNLVMNVGKGMCEFNDGRALIYLEQNKKYGYIDKMGNTVIPCEWDSATDFQDGFAVVGKWDGTSRFCNIIDTEGNIVW